jgi:hypothetical protein
VRSRSPTDSTVRRGLRARCTADRAVARACPERGVSGLLGGPQHDRAVPSGRSDHGVALLPQDGEEHGQRIYADHRRRGCSRFGGFFTGVHALPHRGAPVRRFTWSLAARRPASPCRSHVYSLIGGGCRRQGRSARAAQAARGGEGVIRPVTGWSPRSSRHTHDVKAVVVLGLESSTRGLTSSRWGTIRQPTSRGGGHAAGSSAVSGRSDRGDPHRASGLWGRAHDPRTSTPRRRSRPPRAEHDTPTSTRHVISTRLYTAR